MAESEIIALRQVVYDQSLALKKLSTELEDEREASTSGANEALCMILRLQEEKAAEKMEACQYKRMTEEKLQYAEVSLEILSEVIFQKEMEIASLKFQINAYRHKLASMGVKNLDAEEMETCDYPCLKRSTSLLDKTRFHQNARRNISLPAIQLAELCSGIDIVDKDNSLLLTGGSICRGGGDYMKQANDKEHKVQDSFKKSTWEPAEVRKKVKENEPVSANDEFQIMLVTDPMSLGEESCCSWYSEVIGDNLYKSTPGIKLNGKDALAVPYQMQDADKLSKCDHHSCIYSESEADGDTIDSINLQDIHVVPESRDGCNREVSREATLEAKKKNGMPKSMPQEAVKFISGDKNLLKKAHTFQENKLPKQQKGASVNFHSTCAESQSEIISSEADIEQLKKQMQKLEDDVRNIKQADFERNKELHRLLREIVKEVDTIQSEIRDSMLEKCPQEDESSSVLLTEAMLYFWL